MQTSEKTPIFLVKKLSYPFSRGGHALDQMQNRRFTPSVVEETIQNGMSMPNKVAGKMQFYDPINNTSVVTEDGKVVTVMYGRSN